MYGQEKTPEIILEDFKRYKRAENSRRRGAFGLNFDQDEGRRFVEECQILRDLEGLQDASLPAVPLEMEVHFPAELTDDQLLYYYSRKPSFARGQFVSGEEYYGRFYLLELANELHQIESLPSSYVASGPSAALASVFLTWDAMQKAASAPAGSVSDSADYLLRLCLSFLIAHPDMAEEIRTGLIARDLYWRYDLIGEIRQGRFARADLFVKKYARLLKDEEINGDKAFVEATWSAMPQVFSALDQTFGDNSGHLFRRFLTAGQETSTEVEILPVRRRALGTKRRITLADTCFLDSRPSYGSVHKDRWVRTEWVLKEGARDFLYLIHLYAESFVREYYRAPKRKRTADRFLKKKYLRTGDDRSVILAMKEVLKDERFEQAIGEGAALYMRDHPVPEEAGPVSRKRHEKMLFQMDHEQPESGSVIDYERFRQARTDADSVLQMLHKEEIDYGNQADQGLTLENDAKEGITGEGAESAMTEAGRKDMPTRPPVFTEEEKQYLQYIMEDRQEEAEEYLDRIDMPASLMMKEINRKALEAWDDIVLDGVRPHYRIVNDFKLF